MPQLDFFPYHYEQFWAFAVFFVTFRFLLQYLLPQLFTILSLRTTKMEVIYIRTRYGIDRNKLAFKRMRYFSFVCHKRLMVKLYNFIKKNYKKTVKFNLKGNLNSFSNPLFNLINFDKKLTKLSIILLKAAC